MADLGASNWNETDGSNTTAAPDGMPEGMSPSGVNDWGRATMGAVKRWFNRGIPKLTTGTTTAYVVTYTIAPGAYVDGETYLVRFNATNGAAPTININALGAIPIYKYSAGAWAAVAAGDLTANMICRLSYNTAAGAFFVTSTSVTAIGAAFLAIANTFTATLTMTAAAINEAQGVAIASAATTDIGAATGNYVHVTGTTTITGLGTIQAGTRRKVVFDGILTLTFNATSLITLTGASIVTAAGDVAEFVSEGSGNWRMTGYERKSGVALGYPVFSPITASLSADVALSNIATYFDGPSIAQGTTGTWSVSGSVTVVDTAQANARYSAKLWDGTTVIDSGRGTTIDGAHEITIALSGYLASPAGNLRISVNGPDSGAGKIVFNASGNSKDSTISALRIA